VPGVTPASPVSPAGDGVDGVTSAPSLPAITVVLPTYRRPTALRAALAGLAAQVAPELSWDVIVVDNDPEADTDAIGADGLEAMPVAARLVREREPGAAAARNRGIAEATGGIIAFLDDDVVPDARWLARLVAPVVADECDGTGGRVVLDPLVPRPRWLDDERLGGYLAAFDLGADPRPLGPDEYVITANAAFRAAALRDIGGFDERLGPRAGTPMVNDDVLLCRRLHATGARLRYEPLAVVVHELPSQRVRLPYLLRRAHAQGRSDCILDRERLAARWAGGVGWAVKDLGSKLRVHARDGLRRPEVSFTAACDIARAAGCLQELAVQRLRGAAGATVSTRRDGPA
jgi:GT2 family glycosyltransferase